MAPRRSCRRPATASSRPSRSRPVHLSATRITPRGVGQRPRWRRPVLIVILVVIVALIIAAAAGVDLPLLG